MSRSRRKQPYFYMCGCTPSIYKKQVNRGMRRAVRIAVQFEGEEELLPQTLDQYDDVWGAPMDGKKRWCNPKDKWVAKMMRKK